MDFCSTIKKPNAVVTWDNISSVQTQYFTTQLSTLTYSTTGRMSSTTQGTFTTTAEATTISSNVSYSYQEGNVYSTSMTSTTIALPDGRTATSFGTMTTELKYSYYPNRRQTRERYVAVNSNYVGNIYSTLASSTRSSCILFEQPVNRTTFISSIYTPAYTVNTTTEIPVYTVTVTRSRNIFGALTYSSIAFASYATLFSTIGTSTVTTHIYTTRDLMYVSDYTPSDSGFHLNSMTAAWDASSTSYNMAGAKKYLFDWIPLNTPKISFTFIAGINYSIADRIITTVADMIELYTNLITASLTRTTTSNYTSSYLYRTSVTAYENPVISFTYTKNSTTMQTVDTTSLVIPDFDGLISAHNIAGSMYYSLQYTYPFESTKTSYILHSDSITHQYYRSTIKEVTA